MTGKRDERAESDDLVIWVLGTALMASIIFIGVIELFGSTQAQDHTSFFEVLSSSMAGALAGRITSKRGGGGDQEDDMAVIGREATRRVVSEALRGLSDHPSDSPKQGQNGEPDRGD